MAKKQRTAEEKHARKERFKSALADAFGGGERGLLTQAKPFETKEETKMNAVEDSSKAIEKSADPKSGGGFNASQPSEDRTDMSSNARSIFFKKKGYDW